MPPRKGREPPNGPEGRPLDVIEKWEATILGRTRPRRGEPSNPSGTYPPRTDRS